jgi:hypothetical protein
VRYPGELLDQVVRGTAEAIRYRTFDVDRRTGSRRELHAFLFVPRELHADPYERRAIVIAFYGGENSYSAKIHILMQAGFIVLSPAVRGSWSITWTPPCKCAAARRSSESGCGRRARSFVGARWRSDRCDDDEHCGARCALEELARLHRITSLACSRSSNINGRLTFRKEPGSRRRNAKIIE